MADYSEENHYKMLEDMLRSTTKYLCQLFQRRWRDETGTDWQKLSTSEKISILGNSAFQNAKCIHSIARRPGNLEDCELVLLSSAILSFRRVKKYAKENDAVTAIKNLRESLATKYSGKISSPDYRKEREKVRNSLKCLGVKKKDIDNIIFQLKRGRSGNICRQEVAVVVKEKLIRKEGRNEDLQQNRNEEAPGENLFKKGLSCLAITAEGLSNSLAQAASYFSQASKKNHVEATTSLGTYYQLNNNFVEAKKWFEKAAGMDTKSPGGFTLYKCNVDVAEAQRRLGEMYYEGQVRENCQDAGPGGTTEKRGDTDVDLKQAVVWFEKAMENGDGSAAEQMAIFYSKGWGVDKDSDMMRMCYKESMNLKYTPALAYLKQHYLDLLEPEKATHIHKLGMVKEPQSCSQEGEKQFFKAVTSKHKIRKRYEGPLKNFESENGFEIKGLSFMQRLTRSVNYSKLHSDNFVNDLEESIFSAYTHRCFGTADFIEGDPMLEIYPYQHLFQLVEAILDPTETEKLQVLEWTYQILIQGPRLVPMRELTDKGIGKIVVSLRQEDKYKEQGELDEKLRLCCAAFNLFSHCDEMKSIQMLVEGTQRYPYNYTYRTFLCLYVGQKENWTWGLRTAEEGLKVDPKNVELMYLKAVFFSFLYSDTKFEKCVEEFEYVLDNVLQKDPIFPDACYAISELYLQKLENEMKPTDRFRYVDTDLMTANFMRGLEAEAVQLDWFLPYRTSSVKLRVELTMLSCKRDSISGVVQLLNYTKYVEENTVLERKKYLKSPSRKGLIKLHRQNIKDKMKVSTAGSKEETAKFAEITDSPKFRQILSEGLSSLKPITLLEMDPTVEHIFKRRLLELLILVEPDFNPGFLASVGEDSDGDVIRVHVYNFQDEENITKKFSVGSRIAVMNPYLSLTKWDSHSCIRIDDMRCVIFQRKMRSVCGFCGEEDSFHHCSSCQRIYCSKECEELDVERHGHKLVCC